MSAEQYSYIEQDNSSSAQGDELPSYDDLAAQNGPNSRFGRWKSWIEKRAAERYADVTPEELERRRERGWDIRNNNNKQESRPPQIREPPNIYIQTHNLSLEAQQPGGHLEEASDSALPFVCERIAPSRLKLSNFGSRFLPHATTQIRCILPLLAGKLVLIGHDEGLSVLDMFPQERSEHGEIIVKRPNEAQSYPIWRGETVYQMTILELESDRDGGVQGVVLALVGPEPDSPSSSHKDSDFRELRMYNLSSLTSLARWAIGQKGARPLDMHRPAHWQAQHSPMKRHRAQGSIARSIKSLMTDSPQHFEYSTTPYSALLTSPASNPAQSPSTPERGSPVRHDSGESSWDVVEDRHLRWATDYVPLASPGSRLANLSVISYATWSDKNRRSPGGQYLAIATKNCILLYESPKRERAYRYVKEFYTPLPPKRLIFFQQSVQELLTRTSSDSPSRHRHTESSAPRPLTEVFDYGVQLSIFVIFDKKAGWIRLADAVVGEFELRDDGGPPPNPSPAPSLHSRESLTPSLSSMTARTRSRLSFEIREGLAKWILPAQCELPVHDQFSSNSGVSTKPFYFLTKGRRTHILPCPLPVRSSSVPPLHVIYWKNTPKQVSARICQPARRNVVAPPRLARNRQPILQVLAFGESGLEVYETTMSFLNSSDKGKGKGYDLEVVRAQEDLGGLEIGYLGPGGNWDRAEEIFTDGPSWDRSSIGPPSAISVATEDFSQMLEEETGIYGWCRKGPGDYRIFWVGGSYDDGDLVNESDDDY